MKLLRGGLLIFILAVSFLGTIHAECEGDGKPSVYNFVVKSCRVLDLDKEKLIQKSPENRSEDGRAFLKKFYQGAFVTNTGGQDFVYPSSDPNVCNSFPVGKSVKKVLSCACCDTGHWGKCLYSGCFLADEGAPINAFQ